MGKKKDEFEGIAGTPKSTCTVTQRNLPFCSLLGFQAGHTVILSVDYSQ